MSSARWSTWRHDLQRVGEGGIERDHLIGGAEAQGGNREGGSE
jgi:hypothetical protein